MIIKRVGNWKGATNVMENMPELSKLVSSKLMELLAKKGQELTKAHIVAQDLPWAPLNTKYRKSKAAKGQPDKIYQATGFFYDHITSHIARKVVWVGIPEGLTHPETKTAVAEIAELMENGGYVNAGNRRLSNSEVEDSDGKGAFYIPPRALFGPSFDETIAFLISQDPSRHMLSNLKRMRKNG